MSAIVVPAWRAVFSEGHFLRNGYEARLEPGGPIHTAHRRARLEEAVA
jgi:hypothetical protein